MTVSSTSSATDLWQLLQTTAATSASSTTSTSSATSGSAISDRSQISEPGKLFSALQSLAKSNPAEFKKITAELASKLNDAASQSSDSGEADMLKQMGSNFEKASQSGNFSDLFPSSSASGTSASAAGSGSVAPSAHHSHHGSGDHAESSTLNTLFSQAFSQIQTDLGS